MKSYTCDTCGKESFTAMEEEDRTGCPYCDDLCDTCTQPCQEDSDYTQTIANGKTTACTIFNRERDDAGPTGENACLECDNYREDVTMVPYHGIEVPLPSVAECRHGMDEPEYGQYCEGWESISEAWEVD